MRTFNEDMNIYVTIIEILKKFQIKENFFLSPCDEEDYGYEYENLKDKKIQITQFPKRKNCLTEDTIFKINFKNKYFLF